MPSTSIMPHRRASYVDHLPQSGGCGCDITAPSCKRLNRLATALAGLMLTCALVPAQAQTLPETSNETWLVISGAARHFRQDERDWREFNPGVGLERGTTRDGFYYVGGYFLNSYDRHALYAGVRWMPWRWGSLRFGGYALASTGYPSPVLLLPGFSVETRKAAVNFVVAPNISHYSGYVGMQVRVRLD